MLRLTSTRRCSHGRYAVPPIINEPMNSFAEGSKDREQLRAALDRLRAKLPLAVPVIIDGKEYFPGKPLKREIPSENKTVMHTYHHADKKLLDMAVQSSLEAGKKWSQVPFQDRAAVLLKAAQLMSTTWRWDTAAATMFNQAKNPWQAEIDCIAESIDFFRFAVKYAAEIYSRQPASPPGQYWNMVEYRPLEGFVLSISPFNFTAIGANLAAAPTLMGNTVIWKPSDNSLYSNYLVYKVLEEAGMPPGVINFCPAPPQLVNDNVLAHPDMAGVVFTGSSATFNKIWAEVGKNIETYKTYPRVMGETGGKNFHLVHPTADMESVIAGTIRSAFEYQGQKCSACSRAFFPKSKWPDLKTALVQRTKQCKQGHVEDFDNFLCAVIDKAAFDKNVRYIELAKKDKSCKILVGGGYSDKNGWFIEPTIIQTTDLNCVLLKEEIFGPVLTVYVYDDAAKGAWKSVCEAVNVGPKYGLTGGIYCRDRDKIREASDILRHAAGNFYVNDKSTGSIVGQQPFGGARKSGTNDKPGSADFLQRFVSPRTIKESLEHTRTIWYPHQGQPPAEA